MTTVKVAKRIIMEEEEEEEEEDKEPRRFGSKAFSKNGGGGGGGGPISILAADGKRYQLDDATNEYFVEIENALGAFDDEKKKEERKGDDDDVVGDEKNDDDRLVEEIGTLANNALEGADGKEVELMMDARCSRLIERLVAHATDEALVLFLRKACRGWKTYALAMNIFGSRVLESVIRQVSKRLIVDEEGSNRATAKKRGIQEVLKFKEMLLEKEDVDDGFENDNRNRDNDGEEDDQQNQRQDDSLPEAGPRSCLDNLSYVLSSRAKDIAFDQRVCLSLDACFFSSPGRKCRSIRAGVIRR